VDTDNQPPSVVLVIKKDAPVNTPTVKYRQTEAPKYNQANFTAYEQIIKENIGYSDLTYERYDNGLIDNIVSVMVDLICTENPSTVKLGDEVKSRDIVRSVYLKLNHNHISHVISQYEAQCHQIIHKTAYLRKMLYTCFQEMDAHYTNAVRADGLVGNAM